VKQFIRNVLIFLLPLIAFNIFLYIKIPQIIDTSPYFEKMIKVEKSIKSIILSDSHGANLNDDLLFENNILNLSFPSDSYIDMLNKLKFVLKKITPQVVAVTVDRHTLSLYRDGLNNNDLSSYLNDIGTFKGNLIEVFPIFRARNQSVIREYFIKIIGSIFIYNKEKKSSYQPLSWEDQTMKERIAVERVKVQFPQSSYSDSLKVSLLEIIKICAINNIKLIGLRYPLTAEYIKAVGELDSGALKIFKDLELSILDYESLFITQANLFQNEDHLNYDGGIVLSNIIIKDIDEEL